MKEQDYQKVFDHFADLSKRYGLGQIQHATLYEGLKKLIGEVIEIELGAERRRRRKFLLLYLLLGFLVGGVAGWEYHLHKKHPAPASEKTPHHKK